MNIKHVPVITALAASCFIASAAGCNKSYVDRMAALEKEACACQGTRCANETFTKYLVLYEDYKKNNPVMTVEDKNRMGRYNYSIVRCLLDSSLDPQRYRQEMIRIQKKYSKKTPR